MNSTISDDLSREHIAFEAAKCMENLLGQTQDITAAHKELLEINLSITAYIEESKRRLEAIRLGLAREAKSSQKVIEILSEKSHGYTWQEIFTVRFYSGPTVNLMKMSGRPATPRKHNPKNLIKSQHEDNNNTSNKFSERQQARTFVQWYKQMIDNERQNLALYMSEDAVLEWFGRTIKSKNKISQFLKYDMQCSKHGFTNVECIDKIVTRLEKSHRKDDLILASPFNSPEMIQTKEQSMKRRLRSNCSSPGWAEGCAPDEEYETERKRLKMNSESEINEQKEISKQNYSNDEISEINNKGDGMLGRRLKRKFVAVTPPNREVGQGDCLPSTSGTDSNKSHDALNAQLPKFAVECIGYIEFCRTRSNRSIDVMKWDRKCKVQISYSEDPLNVGEYIIWALQYTDDSKCRRNLLAAFEEAAKELKHI